MPRIQLLVMSLLAGTLGAACGNSRQPGTEAAIASSASIATGAPAAARRGSLINPDAAAVVLLYYDLAGIAAPIDEWVEDDARVKYAQPIERAARRESVKAELQAARNAVRGVGSMRLSTDANLSDYDPVYGEFTVRALSPSSVFDFDAFGKKIKVNIGNGLRAQVWRVPPADAQPIRDKVAFAGGRVTLDVLLRVSDVQPGVDGGSITAEVVEYEMKDARNAATLARVQIADHQQP